MALFMNSSKTDFHQKRYANLLPVVQYCLAMLMLLWLTPFLFAVPDNGDLENRVREISHQLRCPTCQAMSVKESDAGLSLNMKNKIREMLKEGKSEDEILAFFVDRYGEWILRSPQKEGFNLILWVTPLALIVIAGAIVIAVLLRKSRQARRDTLQPLSDNERQILEKDLDRFTTD
mgnify:FL=1